MILSFVSSSYLILYETLPPLIFDVYDLRDRITVHENYWEHFQIEFRAKNQ